MLVILEGLVLSFWLLLVCVVGIAKEGPVGLVVFYEQEVKDRVVELGLTTKDKIKKISVISSAALFLPMLTVIPAVVYLYNGVNGFFDGFLQLTKVVGAVWTRIMNDYGHVDDDTPSFAISFYKEYRGQGTGTELMKEMLELLKTQGYKKASLAVQKANYAVRMYEKVGFEVVDENDEEFIMVCNL